MSSATDHAPDNHKAAAHDIQALIDNSYLVVHTPDFQR
jgi:hypothetical protein